LPHEIAQLNVLPQAKDLYVSLDIGSKKNSVAFVHHSGKVLHQYKVLPNNLPGLERIWKKTHSLLAQYGFSSVLFGMEASGPYWMGLYWELEKRCSTLDPQHFTVEALNPQIVRGFKGKFSYKKQKTDPKDALSINRRMRFGEYNPSFLPYGKQLTLRFYTRRRLHLVQMLTAEKLRFLSLLFLKFSEYKKRVSQGKLFSNVFGRCSTAILTSYLTCEEIANAPLEELLNIVEENHLTNRVVDLKEKLAALKKAAQESYSLPPEAVEPVNFNLHQGLENIEFLKQQIKAVEEKILPILATIDDPIKTIHGIGPTFAAGIIAETPDLSKYKGHPQLASYLGIIPSMNDTGEFHSEFNRMTKTGNSYGRYYYIEGANSIRRINPLFKEYFQRKYAEGHRRRFQRALGLTTRKLIRIYFHLKMTNTAFKLSETLQPFSPLDKRKMEKERYKTIAR